MRLALRLIRGRATPTIRLAAWSTFCSPTGPTWTWLAKWKWEAAVIERAEPMQVAGTAVKVPRMSDLILLKLAAGGYTDLHDAAALLALADDQAISEIERHISDAA